MDNAKVTDTILENDNNNNNNISPNTSPNDATANTNAPTPASFSPSAAAATTTTDTNNDYTIAMAYQTVETLTTTFRFSSSLSHRAVETCGPDAIACYNWILDNNLAEDKGGPVIPKTDCPHVTQRGCLGLSVEDITSARLPCGHFGSEDDDRGDDETKRTMGRAKDDTELRSDGEGGGIGCPKGENWLSLSDGVVRCSRYVNGHAMVRWQNTKKKKRRTCQVVTDNDTNIDEEGVGHSIWVSLEDFSVWCYQCDAYLDHPALLPYIERLQELKFGKKKKEEEENEGKEEKEDGEEQQDKDMKEEKEQGEDEQGKEQGSPKKNTNNPSNDTQNWEATANHHHSNHNNNNNNYNHNDRNGNKSQKINIHDTPNTTDYHSTTSPQLPDSTSDSSPSGSEPPSASNDLYDEDVDEHGFGGGGAHPHLPKSMKELAEFILSDHCQSIVVLTGAGMSRASGIPDFRSAGGMYETLRPELLTASELEREGMRIDPTMVYEKDFFLENQLPCLELQRPFIFGVQNRKWKATIAHRFVELLHSKIGKLTRLYTQNIDGLEGQCTDLPKTIVIPVHGRIDRSSCELCGHEMPYDEFCTLVRTNIKDITGEDADAPDVSTPIPCASCGKNTMKPDVVLFRSPLPSIFFDSIVHDLPSTSLLMVIGTSLCVGPANSLVYLAPDTALRTVFDMGMVGVGLGIEYGEYAERDFFAQGKCEERVAELLDCLGWIDDLEGVLTELPPGSREIVERYRRRRAVAEEYRRRMEGTAAGVVSETEASKG